VLETMEKKRMASYVIAAAGLLYSGEALGDESMDSRGAGRVVFAHSSGDLTFGEGFAIGGVAGVLLGIGAGYSMGRGDGRRGEEERQAMVQRRRFIRGRDG